MGAAKLPPASLMLRTVSGPQKLKQGKERKWCKHRDGLPGMGMKETSGKGQVNASPEILITSRNTLQKASHLQVNVSLIRSMFKQTDQHPH